MSEPVGNAPRRDVSDIPDNSHKAREAREAKAAAEKEPREPVQKIVEGKVTTRKLPWYKRFARSLIADDAQSIGDYILGDVIVPAVKNLIYDIATGGLDRTMWGTSRHRSRTVLGDRPGLRTRYDRVEPRVESRRLSIESRARHDFDDIVLDTRTEAIEVVEALVELVERYGSASVSDLYSLVGVTGSYADQYWGWFSLRTADVRQVRGGFLLDLPRPESLR